MKIRLTTALWLSTLLAAVQAEQPFEALRAEARNLASQPPRPAQPALAEFWNNLTYDQHRDIRFQMDKGLWAAEKLPFSIDFFHPGWTAKETVDIEEISGNSRRTVAFDAGLFDYGKQIIPPGTPPPPGYAGWRARHPLNSPDYMDEFLVFLGASYFRAIPAMAPYGLSARGLSVNSGLPGVPEEFPVFTKFQLEKLEADAKTLTVHALLESPSVVGAYRFLVTPGQTTVIDIEAEITLRKPVQQLGLAPFSSMFWFGEGTHPRPYDFRPEVHDSDGLLLELASGARHFRPLEHSAGRFRHCVFAMDQPKCWSLVQRDRSFDSYQDTEANYHLRPDVKVEPVEGFSHGKLHLIEMPTEDETNDNVILVWEPEPAFEPGKPHHFRYRLHWMPRQPETDSFAVRATRSGHPVQRPDQVLMTIDFAKPLMPMKKSGDPKWDDASDYKPVVTLNHPDAKLVHADLSDLSMPNVDALPAGLGRSDALHMPQVLRAFFVIDAPPGIDQIDMTCELHDADGNAVSERWTYLWMR